MENLSPIQSAASEAISQVSESQSDSQTPDTQPQATETPQKTEEPSIFDFDSAATKYKMAKFNGKEVPFEELKKGYLLQSDYTKKTQALARQQQEYKEQQKFWDNLKFDLDKVKSNNSLRREFEKIYPKAFHQFLEYASPAEEAQEEAQQEKYRIDPRIEERLSEIDQLKSQLGMITEERTQAAMAKLDNEISKLNAKYPNAAEYEQYILALAKEDPEIDFQGIEKIYQDQEAKLKALITKHSQQQIDAQSRANQKGRDVPSGGSVVGKAPERPKTIEQAKALYFKEIDALGLK